MVDNLIKGTKKISQRKKYPFAAWLLASSDCDKRRKEEDKRLRNIDDGRNWKKPRSIPPVKHGIKSSSVR